jgi:hypothetical protein
MRACRQSWLDCGQCSGASKASVLERKTAALVLRQGWLEGDQFKEVNNLKNLMPFDAFH